MPGPYANRAVDIPSAATAA